MAERYRIAAGNWSNAAQWDGGVSLPGAGDDCYMNGFATTLDQNITVASIRNRAGTVAAAGGTLAISAARTINADVYGGTVNFITFSAAAGNTLTLNGTLRASLTNGGTTLIVSGGGHLAMTGDVYGGQSGGVAAVGISTNGGSGGTFAIIGNVYAGNTNGAYGIHTGSLAGASSVTGDLRGHPTGGTGQAILSAHSANTLTIDGDIDTLTGGGSTLNVSGPGGTTVVNGDVIGGTLAVGSITISVAHNLTINGNVIGPANSNGAGMGINITGSATVTVNGTVEGGPAAGGTAYGIQVNSAGATVYVKKAKGNDYPNSGIASPQPGVFCNNAAYIVTLAEMEFGSGGVPPVQGGRYFIDDAAVNQVKMRQSNAGAITTMGDVPADYPDEADVRDGTAFGFASYTGTLKVPPVGAVAQGVDVDDTVGTAILTQQNVADAVGPLMAAWDF